MSGTSQFSCCHGSQLSSAFLSLDFTCTAYWIHVSVGILAFYTADLLLTVSAISNTFVILNLYLPALWLLWRLAVTMSVEESQSRHYNSKHCYGNCTLCAHRNFRNGSIMTRSPSVGVVVTRVVFPLKQKCCGVRMIDYIIQDVNGRNIRLQLLLLAGDVETNPGPGKIYTLMSLVV